MITMDFHDGLSWRKSTRSGDNQGNCVYVATLSAETGIRDSKDGPAGPQLWVNTTDWTSLQASLKTGHFDR